MTGSDKDGNKQTDAYKVYSALFSISLRLENVIEIANIANESSIWMWLCDTSVERAKAACTNIIEMVEKNDELSQDERFNEIRITVKKIENLLNDTNLNWENIRSETSTLKRTIDNKLKIISKNNIGSVLGSYRRKIKF